MGNATMEDEDTFDDDEGLLRGASQTSRATEQDPTTEESEGKRRSGSSRLSTASSRSSKSRKSLANKTGDLLGFISGFFSSSANSKSRGSMFDDRSLNSIVKINVGGQVFSTSLGTVLNGDSKLLRDLFLLNETSASAARDDDGNIFLDHDPRNFTRILNYLRGTVPMQLPDVGTHDWNELFSDAVFFECTELVAKMNEALEAEKARRKKEEDEKGKLIQKQGRELERMRVELHRLQFEKARAEAEGSALLSKMEFAYNILIVGVTGTGKSSSLNTILNQQACEVSGGQAQGTRGCSLRDGVIDDKHFVSYLDTQGLGADTSVSDEELLEQIMLSTESILQMEIINNILISFDLATRNTPATMANQLTLVELFSELRRSCFVCLTKWNTNSVMMEWNTPLKTWMRKFRRAKSIDKITQDPPSYEEMYRCYCQYLLRSFSNKQDGGAFAKVAAFLTFFESRVLFMYNLDPVQIEDMEYDELEPYHVFLYQFYRKKALNALKRGSTIIHTHELAFLKDDEDTMGIVAQRLVQHREKRIVALEKLGQDKEKKKILRQVFQDMYVATAEHIEKKNYEVNFSLMEQMNQPEMEVQVGCSIQ